MDDEHDLTQMSHALVSRRPLDSKPASCRYCSKVRTPVAPESVRIIRPFLPSAVTKTSQCAVPPGWPSSVIVPVQSASKVYVPLNVSRCATVWRREVCLPRDRKSTRLN